MLSQRNDCSAATSSPPLVPSQQNCAPSTQFILSQDNDITMFPTASDQNDLLRMNSTVLQNEMTDSDFKSTCLSPERMLLNAMQVDPNPFILKDTALEPRFFQASFCSQKPGSFGKTTQAIPDSVFPSVVGAGDSNTCYNSDVHVCSNVSGSGSFVDMNSSDIESLFQSPLGEFPSNSNMVTTPNRKRTSSGEEVAASPSKIARGLLEDSPLGSAKFMNLSLTSTCQKQLFPKH